MAEATWAAPGKKCMCLHEGPWFHMYLAYSILPVRGDERPGPKFMEPCVVADIDYAEGDDEGHHVKLYLEGYPDRSDWFCACQFQPLDELEDEKEQVVTAPVSRERQSEKV